MAYMSQDRKKTIVAAAKAILKKYGVKATFAVDNHSTLVCNIKSAKIDFFESYYKTVGLARGLHGERGYLQVNHYHFQKHFEGKAKEFLTELIEVMNVGNHDNSDIMTDYFDVGWYINVNIGRWDKPFVVDKGK